MVWGLCYKLTTIKNHRLADRLPTKKTASQLSVDLVFNTDNNKTRGHSSLGKFFSRFNAADQNLKFPSQQPFFWFFLKIIEGRQNPGSTLAKGDGLLAKLELEVPDEVKLAQAEVELTPAFMTKSGGPYKCPP